nr:unnamed protein product [Callosobruchus analis]
MLVGAALTFKVNQFSRRVQEMSQRQANDHQLQPFENVVKKVYYLLSVFLVSIRITCVCVYGGHVYEEWLKIGSYLNSIPSMAYNFEAERLTQHVLTCPLVLTGNNFFNITRGLILKVS